MGTISGTVSSFQSGGAFAGWRTLTIDSSLMSECCEGYEPPKNDSKWLCQGSFPRGLGTVVEQDSLIQRLEVKKKDGSKFNFNVHLHCLYHTLFILCIYCLCVIAICSFGINKIVVNGCCYRVYRAFCSLRGDYHI